MARSHDLEKGDKKKRLSRRQLLMQAAGVAGAAVIGMEAPSAAGAEREGAADGPGRPPSAIGSRSAFEQAKREAGPTSSRTPLQSLQGTITPSDLHFERHHSGVPSIDPNAYRLLIHGMVERPTVLTLADLKRFPPFTRI